MATNLKSLSLLRNGKVYATKELALQGLMQSSTNDGVLKLARYLDSFNNIRTVAAFYANASEMEDAGGGNSYYTVIDIEGSSADVVALSGAVNTINETIGTGFTTTDTITKAIEEINNTFGTGLTTAHTVADALSELNTAIREAMTITLESEEGTGDILKVYTLKQGGVEIGKINIPKDLVVESGSLVHGTWNGDVFTEDPNGPDTAIKLVIANQADPIYINAKDLVVFYQSGNGITVDNTTETISIHIDSTGEPFLTVGENGLKLSGVQDAIDSITLSSGKGISIDANNKINAVAAQYSAEGIVNPITVDDDGIKFASTLDCGLFD